MRTLAALLLSTVTAWAQVQMYSNFQLIARAPDMVANATSQNIALPPNGTLAIVCNRGIEDAYINFGAVTVAADPVGSILLGAGTCGRYSVVGFSNMAAISSFSFGQGDLITTMVGTGNP